MKRAEGEEPAEDQAADDDNATVLHEGLNQWLGSSLAHRLAV